MGAQASVNASGPGTKSYQILLAGGFKDAWSKAKKRDPGFTWGQDADLRNVESKLSQRLDLVLYRGGKLKAKRAYRIGHKKKSKTRSGLCTSTSRCSRIAAIRLPVPLQPALICVMRPG